MSALTWNCENLKNSVYELHNILEKAKPSFAFLSEPQLFQCDANQFFQYIWGGYCWHLNSEDLHDPELPMTQNRSFGGTAVLWQKNLDPYVEVVSTTSAAFLPIILKMPGLRTSIHIAIYMPTHGKG